MWFRFKMLIQYYFRAITVYNVQSSFVFDLINNVLDTDKEFYSFDKIEMKRKQFKNSSESFKKEDFGAGSSLTNSVFNKISKISSHVVSSKSKCRILFNLVNYFNPSFILELGTSLGISSSYMACANSKNKVITIEGDRLIAIKAMKLHQELNFDNIEVRIGKFSTELTKIKETIDLAFIDGHHRKEPTLTNFRSVMKNCHEESIIVLDDLYWSEEMKEMWEEVKAMNEVSLTIDLFEIGIVFFNKKLSKENITYIPFKFKPWKIGLFN